MKDQSNSPYDHSRKIGNEGDAVKHPVLVRLIDHLIAREHETPFVYLESHCGRPSYKLPEDGEWKNGVGRIASSPLLAAARLSWQQDPTSEVRLPNMRPYVEVGLGEQPAPGSIYPGSSGLVCKLLERKHVDFRFFLWEKDSIVCQDLMKDFPEWQKAFVCRGDGIAGANHIENPSFVFFDPFDLSLDAAPLEKSFEIMAKKSVPFLCWTPLVGRDTSPQGQIRLRFRDSTSSLAESARVIWNDAEEESFWGCELFFSKSQADTRQIIEETLHEVIDVLGENWVLSA